MLSIEALHFEDERFGGRGIWQILTILPLHDADLAKRALADNTQKAEVIEVDFVGEAHGF
jgi:hypothetical protein